MHNGLLTVSSTINAQTVFGKWNSRDKKTGEIDSVIEVYEKDGEVFAKIIDIIDPKLKNSLCTLCKGSRKNKPVIGLKVLYSLKKKRKKWSKGYILDPRSGNFYNCYIKLVATNKLKVRGYFGITALGKSVYWDRIQ
ncbi:MAG: DUF2147 domain-containing protein [Polaribacter sp.]|uniref:DUF2147 domain-containing protein n=1 Tax=Polaribacter sp. TaxID=1920175 RepID=UPI002F35EB82